MTAFSRVLLLLLAGTLANGHGAAALKGVVRLNELGGAPIANAEITGPGALPQTSGDGGFFELNFPNSRPGDQVELTVQKKGLVPVHYIMLQAFLPADPEARTAEILLCKEGDREEMACRFFRLKFFGPLEKRYSERVRELEERYQADSTALAVLQRELAEAKAAAEKAAAELARMTPGPDSELYERALRLCLDGKIEAALGVLSERELEGRKLEAKRATVAAKQRAAQVAREYQLKGQLLALGFRFAEARKAYEEGWRLPLRALRRISGWLFSSKA
jgi:hypothetical protein